MKIKGQNGFAIVNIILGVILTIASIIMFADLSTYPGPFIVLPIGIVLLVFGCIALKNLRINKQMGTEIPQGLLKTNFICFILSCVILAAVVSLPIIAPLF